MDKRFKPYSWSILTAAGLVVASTAFAQDIASDANDYINPDRPGIADGSNVIDGGHFQIESGIQQEERNGGHDRTRFAPTLLRLGLDENWELRAESNVYTWTKSNSSQGIVRNDGAAPASLGVKYHFMNSQGVEQPSLGAILRLFPASGSGDFQTHNVTGDFRLAADWDFAPDWSLNPNVGLARYEDSLQRLFTAGLFAMTLNYNPSKVLNFFVDTGVQSPEARHGKTAAIYDAGVAYIVGHEIQLDFSIGTGASGAAPPHPFVSAGISKRF
jgi:hypothetical protein